MKTSGKYISRLLLCFMLVCLVLPIAPAVQLVSAQTGVIVFQDNFEGGFDNWTVYSLMPEWGLSDYRSHSPTHSAYCAVPNEDGYSDEMDTIMYRDIDVTGCTSATVDFWYWLDIEQGYDYLFYAGYYDGTDWHWDYSTDVNTDWVQITGITIPGNATRIGFRFTSDYYVTLEGAYIDDVVLHCDSNILFSDDFESGFNWTVLPPMPEWGLSDYRSHSPTHSAYCAVPNEDGYSDEMDTIMYREIDTGGYALTTIDFYYWLEIEEGWDYLFYAGYYDGVDWHWPYFTDVDTDWVQITGITIPDTATRIGFRFTSDEYVTYEGAYIDDVIMRGHCGGTANVFTDDFEDNFNWTVETVSGDYEWGLSDYRSHSPTHSAYCAVPSEDEYADNMDTIMYREIVDTSECTALTLDFYYWLEIEQDYDYLFYAGYYDGAGWHWPYRTDTDTDWAQLTEIFVPATATRIGFRFTSDYSVTYEGAYIDDVAVNCFAAIPCMEEIGGAIGGPSVGIDVYPVNKLGLLMPWFALALVIALGTRIAIKRCRQTK